MTNPPEGVTAPEGLAAIARVQGATAGLPEVEQIVDGHGHTSFQVRGKTFVMVGQGTGSGSLSIKSDPDTQRYLIEHRGFLRTRYIGQHGWVSVPELPPRSWDEIDDLVVDGYLLAAPKTLARKVAEARED